MKKHINSATEQYQDEYTDNWVLDDTPTEGSFNAVTSDGVAKAIEAGGGGATYTAGDGISISDENVISADFSDVQAKLTAGSNISINDGVISATDTTYTAGSNISISDGVISATDTTYTAGTNISIDNGVISATDTTYTAGSNISIDNGVISATDTTYTAGSNISINDGVISATDTTYSAGSGVSILNGEISADYTAVQAKLTAGSGIDITGNTISATGGGSSTVHVDASSPLAGDGSVGSPLSLTYGYGLQTSGGSPSYQYYTDLYEVGFDGAYVGYNLDSTLVGELLNGHSIQLYIPYGTSNGNSDGGYPALVKNLDGSGHYDGIVICDQSTWPGYEWWDQYFEFNPLSISSSSTETITSGDTYTFVIVYTQSGNLSGNCYTISGTAQAYTQYITPVELQVDSSIIPAVPSSDELVPYHDSSNDGQVLTVDYNGDLYWNTPATIVGKGLVVVNALPASPVSTYLYLVKGDGIYLGSTCVIKSDTIPVPPGPSFDPYTLRFQFDDTSYDPTQSQVTWKSGSTWTQVTQSPNVWDYSHNTSDWSYEFSDGMSGFFNMTDMGGQGARVIGGSLGNVTNANSMFTGCDGIVAFGDVADTGNITDWSYAFSCCSNMEWDSTYTMSTTSATNMSGMFQDCGYMTIFPKLSSTDNVTDMSYQFNGCYSIANNIPAFSTDSVVNVNSMFNTCRNVSGGMESTYMQMDSSGSPYLQNHIDTFSNCGVDGASASELNNIPSSWGGTGT